MARQTSTAQRPTPAASHTPAGPAKALPAPTATTAIVKPTTGQSSRAGRVAGPRRADDDQRPCGRNDAVDDRGADPSYRSAPMSTYTERKAARHGDGPNPPLPRREPADPGGRAPGVQTDRDRRDGHECVQRHQAAPLGPL